MKTFFSFVLFVLGSALIFAQTNTITYQGKLLDNNNLPVNATGLNMNFAVYDSPSGGNKLWPPNFASASKTVDVNIGLYSATLGTGTGNDEVFTSSIFSGNSAYLEVNVNGTILPRTSITNAPKAFISEQLTDAAWQTPGQIGITTPNSAQFSTITVGTGATSYTLPASRGANDQVMVTDASGNVSWQDQSSGGGGGGIPSPGDEVNGDLLTFDGTNWVAKSLVIQNTGSGQSINNMQPTLVVNYCIALQGIFPNRNGLDPFVGEIQIYGFNFAPQGFAYCDGQLLAIAQYTALFSLLGTYYGGNGQTTFGLPDLRGRTPIHQGQGPGLTPRNIGQSFGAETITINVNQLPAHSHTIIFQ